MTISSISTISSSVSNQTPSWYEDLKQASREGNLDKIQLMIKQSNITLENFPNEFIGCFMEAAKKGHKDIIDFFLSLNALKVIKLKNLVYSLEPDLASEFHREIVDAVITFIKSDIGSPILPEYRLYDFFRAALANNRIKIVEAITKSIDPSYLYDALKSMVEKGCIDSEGWIYSRYYGDFIEAIIKSLTSEISWKIIKIDAGVVNAGATNHNSMEVIKAITKSMDPSFLYSALKSSLKEKQRAKGPSALGYYRNIVETTIRAMTPELAWTFFNTALDNDEELAWEMLKIALDSRQELAMTLIKDIPLEQLKLAFS